jgi:uncharacterized protein DUF3226
MSPPASKSPYRLVVEGPDDKWTLIHLLQRHGFNWEDSATTRPFVHEAGGIATMLGRDFLSTALKSYDRLGLVLDADFPPNNRWQPIRDVLATLGISLPQTPPPDGLITGGLKPNSRLGVWVMPDNSQPGRIEEFIEKLVPANHPTWPHAQGATTQAQALGAPLRAQDHIKGALHAWLA